WEQAMGGRKLHPSVGCQGTVWGRGGVFPRRRRRAATGSLLQELHQAARRVTFLRCTEGTGLSFRVESQGIRIRSRNWQRQRASRLLQRQHTAGLLAGLDKGEIEPLPRQPPEALRLPGS